MRESGLPVHPRPSAAAMPVVQRVSGWRRALRFAVLLYVAAVALLWLWLSWQGDRHWAATLVLFGPRWVCAVPLPPLVFLAAIFERRLLPPLLIAGIVIVFGILAFNLGFSRAASGSARLRVLTCNVEGAAIRPELLAIAIDDAQADVVALQEFARGTPLLWPPGWHVIERHQFVLASRFPIVERESIARPQHRWLLSGVPCTLQLPQGTVQLFNMHLESPRAGIEAVISRRVGVDLERVEELRRVIERRALESRRAAEQVAAQAGPKIILGDFNMPADSTIFRNDWSAYTNAFSQVGWGFGFTKVSEKRGWSYGARIDHILVDSHWRVLNAWVGRDVGSDHFPLVAELEWLDPGR